MYLVQIKHAKKGGDIDIKEQFINLSDAVDYCVSASRQIRSETKWEDMHSHKAFIVCIENNSQQFRLNYLWSWGGTFDLQNLCEKPTPSGVGWIAEKVFFYLNNINLCYNINIKGFDTSLRLPLMDAIASLAVKVLWKFTSLLCFRVYQEVFVHKNPTYFSRWSVREL